MSNILVEQTTKELAHLLDDLDALRERFGQVNPAEWVEHGRSERDIYDAIERCRGSLQIPFVILGDWERLMPRTEGIPDAQEPI